MIFVTVGTHEQQFNRLISKIDFLLAENYLKEEVIIQSGYSDVDILNCEYKDMMEYAEIEKYMKKADIIITHGGPGSIMQALAHGKSPIIVPRQKKYREHVDDHQVLFANKLKEKNYNVVYDIENLLYALNNYSSENLQTLLSSNNNFFVNKLIKLTSDIN